jgi:hypothetical protein
MNAELHPPMLSAFGYGVTLPLEPTRNETAVAELSTESFFE